MANLLKNPGAEDGEADWDFTKSGEGKSEVRVVDGGNAAFSLEQNASNGWAHIFQDVTGGIPTIANEGQVLLIVGVARADHQIEDSLHNRPYLYGYQMNEEEQILQYMQGQQLLHSGNTKEWRVLSGIFQLESGTSKVRFFMKQGNKNGVTLDAVKAWFDDLELHVFDNAELAQKHLEEPDDGYQSDRIEPSEERTSRTRKR